MASDRTSIQPEKVRLRTLNHLDGRTTAARRCRDLIDEIELDLGGSDTLTAGARELVKRAAVVGAVLEDHEARWLAGDESISALTLATLGNAQRRLFKALGLRRAQRPAESLEDTLVANYRALNAKTKRKAA
jgi:hypothetical protein